MAVSGAAGAVPGLTFHHVGVAVRSIDEAIKFYCETLGLRQITSAISVASQKVRVCFVELNVCGILELVEGTESDSPVRSLIEKTGGGPYHLCFRVPDLEAAIEVLGSKHCLVLTRFGQRVLGLSEFAFLLTPTRHLFELCASERHSSRTVDAGASERRGRR